MFERATHRSQSVFARARVHADEFSHKHVHSGHIAIGLAHESEGVAAHIFRHCHVDLDALISRVAVTTVEPMVAKEELVSLDAAATESARVLNHNYCGTEHLLMGICLIPSLTGAAALVNVGASLCELGQNVLSILGVAGRFDLNWNSFAGAIELP